MQVDPTATMRSYIMLAEEAEPRFVQNEPLEEAVIEEPVANSRETDLVEALRVLAERMRAHMESSEDPILSEGVETGLQRAADMVEGLVARFERGGDLGS